MFSPDQVSPRTPGRFASLVFVFVISILIIGFTQYLSVFLRDTNVDGATLAVLSITVSGLFLIAGLFIHRAAIIRNSFVIGGGLSLLFTIFTQLTKLGPAGTTAAIGITLLILVAIVYHKFSE